MIKTYISYSQVKNNDFQEFIDSSSLRIVNAEALFPCFSNII